MLRHMGFWMILLAAIAMGIGIHWIDSRPNWDDAGVTAGLIVVVAGAFGFASPKRAWLWAIAVGIWIPLAGILHGGGIEEALVLLIAIVGAYAGVLFRKLISIAI